jgi:hypothetical protein
MLGLSSRPSTAASTSARSGAAAASSSSGCSTKSGRSQRLRSFGRSYRDGSSSSAAASYPLSPTEEWKVRICSGVASTCTVQQVVPAVVPRNISNGRILVLFASTKHRVQSCQVLVRRKRAHTHRASNAEQLISISLDVVEVIRDKNDFLAETSFNGGLQASTCVFFWLNKLSKQELRLSITKQRTCDDL